MKIICALCRRKFDRPTGHVNRSRKIGAPLYCGRKCSGLGRRSGKTKAQKVEAKRLYDIEYRRRNWDVLKAKKAAYFQRTYDPAKAAKERKKNMARHVAYCRQPRYKAWKREYDKRHRAREYGPFAEAYMLAVSLNREIKSRASNYEIRLENQTLNKRQTRARQGAEAYSRDRHSRAQG